MEFVIVESENTTTENTASRISRTHSSYKSGPGKSTLIIGSASTLRPAPHGIAIIIFRRMVESTFFLSSRFFPDTRDLIRLGIIAEENADAIAIGAVVSNLYLLL